MTGLMETHTNIGLVVTFLVALRGMLGDDVGGDGGSKYVCRQERKKDSSNSKHYTKLNNRK